jgi:hypothetical protein
MLRNEEAGNWSGRFPHSAFDAFRPTSLSGRGFRQAGCVERLKREGFDVLKPLFLRAFVNLRPEDNERIHFA